MGPSKDEAFDRGERAYEEVKELLKQKYAAIDDTLGFNFGALTQRNLDLKYRRLKRVIQEILWDSDCHTW